MTTPAERLTQGSGWRPEIDGLRAVAVLAVILFHAQPNWAPGGYLGVDLFFVISGYLITGILVRDLEGQRLSFGRFYLRRARRILPALLVVMLLCIPPALMVMLPDDLENFGQSLVATALFANNILLLLTSGYFELENQFKPLLHTWSLGVEEQYYLIAPLMLAVAWRLGRRRGVALGVAAITASSFALSMWLPREANFFLILSRGWEIGAGSLVLLGESRLRAMLRGQAAIWAVALGLALAILPFFLTAAITGPGIYTLPTIIGAGLILAFGAGDRGLGRILAAPPVTGIGLISYSAYLIHQPVFAFARIVSLDPPPGWLMLVLILPILAFAWVLWRFVEQPCRDAARVSTPRLLALCAGASLIVVAAGLTFHLTSGFYRNWPQLAGASAPTRGANIAYNLGPDRFARQPLPETSERPRLLVIGNSFARDFINMTTETLTAHPPAISLILASDCARPRAKWDAAISHADMIVLATRFTVSDVACMAERLKQLRGKTSVPILILGRKSFGSNNNAVMLLPEEERRAVRVRPTEEALAANAAARRIIPAEAYIDVLAVLSDDDGKIPVFTPQDKFISQDREHLTQPGARFLGEIVFRDPRLAPLMRK